MFEFIKIIVKKLLLLFPLGDILIFESNPDFSCNTYPVFKELRRRLPRYKMIWLTTGDVPLPEGVDGTCNLEDGKLSEIIKWYWFSYRAKAFISCNRYRNMGGIRKSQFSLFLAHGCKMKKTKKHNYCAGAVVDYFNIQSHFFDEITCYESEATPGQLVYLGYPRCDWFYVRNDIIGKLSTIGVKGEYIIWLPTFRNHRYQERNVRSNKYESMGIPLIYNQEMLLECNQFLKEKNLHIIYKPHPVQDVTNLKKIELSNIHVINDKTLSNLGFQLYQVIAESKALISDYSSVYFDYLLLDRPIATTIDDLEQWSQGEGFAYDVESIFKKTTEQVANLDDLYTFIQTVIIDGQDNKREARQKMCEKTVLHRDGNSAKRVADFIMEKIGEK